MSLISETEELTHMRWKSETANKKERRDTSEARRKIMYLEEETLRLSYATNMLSHCEAISDFVLGVVACSSYSNNKRGSEK